MQDQFYKTLFGDGGDGTARKFVSSFQAVLDRNKDPELYGNWLCHLELEIEVKAIKVVHGVRNENYHWIELKNVVGNAGWLYGDADAFAFETYGYWILVDKLKLQQFISEKCSAMEWSDGSGTLELYKLSTRHGKQDVITLVKTLDLMAISSKILSKDYKESAS